MSHVILGAMRHRSIMAGAAVLVALWALGWDASVAVAGCNGPGPTRWQISANGQWGELQIFNNQCRNGLISGSLQFKVGQTTVWQPIEGFWDEEDQKLTFRRGTYGDPFSWQIFTGYYFRAHDNNADIFTGSFEAFANAGGSAVRPVYGWYALALQPGEQTKWGGQGTSMQTLTLFNDVIMGSNGSIVRLTISVVTASGYLEGEIVEGTRHSPIRGLFDRDAQKVTFVRYGTTTDPSWEQYYTGYLIVRLGSSQPDEAFLAGSFEAFRNAGGSAQRSVFGWVAGPAILPPLISGGGF